MFLDKLTANLLYSPALKLPCHNLSSSSFIGANRANGVAVFQSSTIRNNCATFNIGESLNKHISMPKENRYTTNKNNNVVR